MKVLRESKEKHWGVGTQAECDRCDTLVEFENEYDFRTYDHQENKITYECPKCGHRQEVYKPKKTGLPRDQVMPCTTGTDPVRWDDIVKTHRAKESDWYGNVESQQEYLGK